jgi:hypothetical protein
MVFLRATVRRWQPLAPCLGALSQRRTHVEALAAEGAVVFAKEDRVEAGRQFLPERAEPHLAEDEEPEFRQDVIAMPRDGQRLP